MKEENRERQVLLLWGINNKEDLICLNEFEEIQKQMGNFHFIPVMFRDDTWDGEKGIIDREKIDKILSQYEIEIDECGFYI